MGTFVYTITPRGARAGFFCACVFAARFGHARATRPRVHTQYSCGGVAAFSRLCWQLCDFLCRLPFSLCTCTLVSCPFVTVLVKLLFCMVFSYHCFFIFFLQLAIVWFVVYVIEDSNQNRVRCVITRFNISACALCG